MKEEKIFSVLDIFVQNPMLTIICTVFFIVDIALLTCIFYNQINQNKVVELRNNYVELIKSRNELNGLLDKMIDNYTKINEKLSRMETMYTKPGKQTEEKQTQETEAQAGLNSKIASLTADLSTCQNTNLNFISQISEKQAVIASLGNQLRDYEEMTAGMKRLFVQKLALQPTWIKAGEAYTVSDGNFAIVVDGVSDKTQCRNDSTAVVSLMTGNKKKILCVGLDRPETFEYKRKNYALGLLGVRENEQNHEYLVSIIK